MIDQPHPGEGGKPSAQRGSPPFDRLVDSLREADIVISSTGSSDAVIRREEAVRFRQVL